MSERPQKYRLTFEFMLRDKGDYGEFTRRIRLMLMKVVEGWIGCCGEIVNIEKCD